jgi:hypothetical protein
MRLQATDVTKGRRLSLGVVKLPPPEKEKAITQEVNKPPTMEEVAYTQIVTKYPKVEELVNRLGLVSALTNQPIKKVEIPANKVSKLTEIAKRVLTTEKAYSLEEVLSLIAEDTKVEKERAEIGLALMLEAGALERSGDLYYLGGSTPF